MTTGTYSAYLTTSNKITGTGSNLIALKSTSTSSNYDSSLVAYYDMETLTKNLLLADLAGSGNNMKCLKGNYINGDPAGTPVNCGTIGQGPQFVDGKVGKAMQFTGSTNIGLPGDLDCLKGNAARSVSLWVKLLTVSPNMQVILSKGDGGPHNLFQIAYKGERDASVRWTVGTYSFTGYGGKKDAEINRRYHIVVTHNLNGDTNVYIDGVFQQKFNQILNTTNGKLTFGFASHCCIYQKYLNGILDEVRIYNRALSDEEIKALYDASK